MIDLRSDTVTRPCDGMKAAMMAAELGDDVWGDDPTAIAFEAEMAERTGKEAAVIFASGTQSNLAAMLSHCGRGEEILVGRSYHTYSYEAAGAAVLGGIAQCPLTVAADGSLDAGDVAGNIKPDDPHFPITKLLALENTVSGALVPADKVDAACRAARAGGLNCHLDGARLANAVIASGRSWAEHCAQFDTVSICLSKGLGTPIGSVLVGDAQLINRARRNRKLLGGGMRQVGMIAAAGQFALAHNVARMSEDHANAAHLAEGLAQIEALSDVRGSDSNMAFATLPTDRSNGLGEWLKARGVLAGAYGSARFVTHKDVDRDDIDRVVALVDEYYRVH